MACPRTWWSRTPGGTWLPPRWSERSELATIWSASCLPLRWPQPKSVLVSSRAVWAPTRLRKVCEGEAPGCSRMSFRGRERSPSGPSLRRSVSAVVCLCGGPCPQTWRFRRNRPTSEVLRQGWVFGAIKSQSFLKEAVILPHAYSGDRYLFVSSRPISCPPS